MRVAKTEHAEKRLKRNAKIMLARWKEIINDEERTCLNHFTFLFETPSPACLMMNFGAGAP